MKNSIKLVDITKTCLYNKGDFLTEVIMQTKEYIRCPRCELNYILKKEKYCSVCKAEMSADPNVYEDLDLETCPLCKTNFIRPDEIVCSACAKEKIINEEGLQNIDEDWESYVNPEENENPIDEETGEMVRLTDLVPDDEIEELEIEEADFPEISEELAIEEDDEESEEEEDLEEDLEDEEDDEFFEDYDEEDYEDDDDL